MITHKDNQWLTFCESGARIFSTCGKNKVFSIIVDASNHIVGQGYNGVPSGMVHCEDGGCPRFLNDVPSGTNYDSGPGLCFAAHAEANALAHGDGTRYKESTIYVNCSPCLACARQIAASGIKRIVYLVKDDRHCDTTTANFLDTAGVDVDFSDLSQSHS